MPDILIVEDDAHLARLIGATLAADFVTRSAADGHEAIRSAIDQPPDLILLDVNVPGVDGFEVCRAIRAREASDHRPTIVMLTARDDIASKLLAFAAGADDYLVKPIDRLELHTRVSRWVGTRAAQDDLVKRRRREAIEEIVAAICHEVNNPLSAALMGVELVLLREGVDSETVRDIQAVRDSLIRISEVVSVLRAAEDRTVTYVGRTRMINLRDDGQGTR